ncbi:uncharacterized protein LOC129770890 [Toxorhynchites rutilus septentrionalis]|uniref:uncharacterized protein LOC129770890 n=1 Tax=Toxorhynchites rutilus septentrionalis TaxID=329112 RepID=UPI00247959E1|nr:uncharacterized protein LOC129770890 [Toxorhynchites rutilus septentrionalis]
MEMRVTVKMIIFSALFTVVVCLPRTFSENGLSKTVASVTTETRKLQVNHPTILVMSNPEFGDEHKRTKRALLFRPLFVYRQQQVNKQRLQKQREQQQQPVTAAPTRSPPRPQRPIYAYQYPYMRY